MIIKNKDIPHPQKYSYPMIAKKTQQRDKNMGGPNKKL